MALTRSPTYEIGPACASRSLTRPSPSSTTGTRDSDAFSEIELGLSVESTSTTACTSRSRSSTEKSKNHDHDADIARPEAVVLKESKSRRISYTSNETAPPLPPPYADPPSYSSYPFARAARSRDDKNHEPEHDSEPEPRTLPMYLFFLGFICPIFWVIGTFTLRLPHTERERRPGGRLDPFRMWSLPEAEKAEAEREVERMGRRWEVEWRWGKRCMWATVVFVGVALVVGVVVWGVVGGRSGR